MNPRTVALHHYAPALRFRAPGRRGAQVSWAVAARSGAGPFAARPVRDTVATAPAGRNTQTRPDPPSAGRRHRPRHRVRAATCCAVARQCDPDAAQPSCWTTARTSAASVLRSSRDRLAQVKAGYSEAGATSGRRRRRSRGRGRPVGRTLHGVRAHITNRFTRRRAVRGDQPGTAAA